MFFVDHTAEVLLTLNRTEEANKLSEAAYQYYFDQVKRDVESGKETDDLERYLLRASAEMLARNGKPDFLEQVESLN